MANTIKRLQVVSVHCIGFEFIQGCTIHQYRKREKETQT